MDEPLSSLDPTRAQQAIRCLVDVAHARGVTLLATLHHVEMALAHFPRIIGLRGGEVAFDLPTAQVTRDHLQRLYAQHEDELLGGVAAVDVAAASEEPAPAVVAHCR
jgi:phosphonate transport system ATP-binding protein